MRRAWFGLAIVTAAVGAVAVAAVSVMVGTTSFSRPIGVRPPASEHAVVARSTAAESAHPAVVAAPADSSAPVRTTPMRKPVSKPAHRVPPTSTEPAAPRTTSDDRGVHSGHERGRTANRGRGSSGSSSGGANHGRG